MIKFPEREGHGDIARLAVSLNLMRVAARYLERGGYIEEAARECTMVAEAVSQYLWWGLAIRRILRKAPPRGGNTAKWQEVQSLHDGYMNPGAKKSYWSYLLRLGIHSLQKADRLFRQGRRAEEKGAYLVVDKIPANLVTSACSLGMVAALYDLREEQERLWGSLRDLLVGWRGAALPRPPGIDGPPRNPDSRRERKLRREDELWYFKETLSDSLIRHSFPVLNRLQGLKVLIDAEVIGNYSEAALENVIPWTSELLDLVGKVKAPLHFTPLQSGSTCALVYLCYHENLAAPDSRWSKETLKIQAAARRDLLASEEMSTMRRAFYENISNLFYLYDDFNDRQLHFNHALQMAGLEYVSLLRTLMKYSEPPAQEPPAFLVGSQRRKSELPLPL